MESKLHIGLVQFEVTDNINKNVEFVNNEIGKLARVGTEIIVLPEMWSCGFNYGILEGAAESTPLILELISELAKKHCITIVGSLPEKSGGKIYNTAFSVGTDGSIIDKYRKIHLFPPFKENLHFSPGNKITTFTVKGVKMGTVICFDIRFPELARKLAVCGIKVLVVCAQWPKVRYFQWVTLLRARAIENQIFVVAVNRCGIQNKQQYLGHSIIINPYGETVYEAYEYEDSTDVLIDLTLIQKFKKQFDSIALRKPKVYKL